jgi:hypothetical protein
MPCPGPFSCAVRRDNHGTRTCPATDHHPIISKHGDPPFATRRLAATNHVHHQPERVPKPYSSRRDANIPPNTTRHRIEPGPVEVAGRVPSPGRVVDPPPVRLDAGVRPIELAFVNWRLTVSHGASTITGLIPSMSRQLVFLVQFDSFVTRQLNRRSPIHHWKALEN